MIAIEPVIAPATSLSTISSEFEAIEIARRARLARRASAWQHPRAGAARHARVPPSRSRSPGTQRARRAAAVADRVLLRPAPSSAIVRPSPDVVGHERGVVAEAAARRAARAPARPRSARATSCARRRRARRRRARRRTPPAGRRRAHLAQQLGEVLLVARVARRRSAPTRRRGAPPSARASMPESSATAGMPVAAAAARALPSAFSANVSPVSGGSSTSSGSGTSSCGASRICRSSRSLCSLRVARTSLTLGAESGASPAPPPGLGGSRSCSMPAGGQRQQLVERRARERRALGRGLDLDEAAVAGHHHVRVHLGASSPPSSRGRAARARRPCRTTPPRPSRSAAAPPACPSSISAVERELERDVAAGDRRAARAAVGLEHVAVDPDRALAERREVDRPRAASGRSAAGSRRCARPRGPSRRRAACARPWRRAASRTRP